MRNLPTPVTIRHSIWLAGPLILAACGSTSQTINDGGSGGTDGAAPTDLGPLAPPREVEEGRFATSKVCAACHQNADNATAMRDELGAPIAPFNLWQSSMMANASRDPLWRATVSAEVAAIPSKKEEIESTCMTCHTPMASTEARLNGETVTQLNLLYGDSARSQLALDGVSCTACHQILEDKLGTEASFSGQFVIGDSRVIVGPHANPFTMPMQRRVDYRPIEGTQISRSALCGSCHTLHTEALRLDGTETGEVLPEQTPYLEWRNSIFTTEVAVPGPMAADCQDCHAPKVSEAGVAIDTAIARRPNGSDFGQINSRSPFGRHIFIGGNTLIPQILRDNREVLSPLATTEAFNATIALTKKQLREETATIALTGAAIAAGKLTGSVQIVIATGHKFPSAHPSRRAWLHLAVVDAAGNTVFESGGHDANGQLLDSAGNPLPSELPNGPFVAHTTSITAASGPQVYETVMGNTDGDVTYRLLQGARYLKDNRLLPPGWNSAGETNDIKVIGVTADADFVGGGDTIALDIALGATDQGPYSVTAELLYQPLSTRYAAELFTADTAEVRAFKSMYERADRTPELIDTATVSVSAVASSQ